MSIQYAGPGDLSGSYGVADSFPKDFDYGGADDAGLDDGAAQPRILLMGLRRSGKSSIQKASRTDGRVVVAGVIHLAQLKGDPPPP